MARVPRPRFRRTTVPAAPGSGTSGPTAWAASTAYATGQQVTYLGVVYTRKTAGTSGATFDPTLWDAAAAVAPARLTNAYITNATSAVPVIAAHRMNGGIAPEYTRDSLDLFSSSGCKIMELDVELLSDGGVAVAHDTTVDAKFTGTGLVTSFSTPAFRNMRCDAGVTFLPSWPNDLRGLLLNEVLTHIERHNLLAMIECKSAAVAGPAMDLIEAMGCKDRVVLFASSLTTLAAMTARGFVCGLTIGQPNPTVQQIADLKASGATFVGQNGGSGNTVAASAAAMTPWVTAGVKVYAYGVYSRYNRDIWAAAGASVLMGDDAQYLLPGDTHKRTTDPFALKTWYPGSICGKNAFELRGAFTGTASFTLDPAFLSSRYTSFALLQGWGFLGSTFTLPLTLTIDALDPNTAAFAVIDFSCPDDRVVDDTFYHSNGYHLELTETGDLKVFKKVGGAAGVAATTTTQLGATVNIGALTQGQSIAFIIQVTATQIIIKTGGTTRLTVTDSTFRGPYFYFGYNSPTAATPGSALITSWSAVGPIAA